MGRRKRPSLPTEWWIVSPTIKTPSGEPLKERLRAPTILELAELRVAILCKCANEIESLLGISQFRTLMRLIAWEHHQLSPPQPLDQELIDFARWAAFNAGIEKEGWATAADYAAEELRNSPFAASPSMMTKSHEKVQQRLRGLKRRRGDAFKFKLT
jgi:hypothetical protein